MKIMHWMLAVVTFASPLVIRAQRLPSHTQAAEPALPNLALVRTTRVGISSEQERRQRLNLSSAADTSSSGRGSRGYHVLMGAVTGSLGGAAVGAIIGALYDSSAGPDAMIPASAILALYGTVIGLVTGVVVGLVWPTK